MLPDAVQTVPPSKVKLPYETAERGLLPDELAIQFKVNGERYVAFVPVELVDREQRAMMVLIVGRWPDGSYLVQLPSDTINGGSKVRVPPGVLIGPTPNHDPE
jgi:hypothetical protein